MKESGFTEEAGKNCMIVAVHVDHLLGAISTLKTLLGIPNLKSSHRVSNALEHVKDLIQKLISRNTPPVISDWEMMRGEATMTTVVEPQFRSP